MIAVDAQTPARSTRHVVHLTSVHPATDTRIFHKQCASLAAAGYRVTLVVAGAESTTSKGVEIVGVSRGSNRLSRAALGLVRVGRAALRQRGDIYHFHDPELLPLGLVLRALRKKVVYDAHEWVKGDVGSKPYLPGWVAKPLGQMVHLLELLFSRVGTQVIGATPFIASQFPTVTTTVIHNYPDLGEVTAGRGERDPHLCCYVGGLGDERCASELLAAIRIATDERPEFRMRIAGPLEDGVDLSGLSAVEYVGVVGRAEVADILAQSASGILLFRALPNIIDAMPTKYFEYSGAGLATIIPRSTREIIRLSEQLQSSIVVDETDPRAIADALIWMFDHPQEVAAMGARAAVGCVVFSWANEAERLVVLYDRLLDLC
jgi:glycosyltransferase involved in cell wall biosynthesis